MAAALVVEYGVSTYAIKGEDRDTYYSHIDAAIDHKPQITMDDGADVVGRIHADRREALEHIVGGTEETTTGVIRLKAMAADGALDEEREEFDLSGIDISQLGTGHHTLYFRLQDNEGNWGVLRQVHFEIYERGTIQAAEYYVVDEEDDEDEDVDDPSAVCCCCNFSFFRTAEADGITFMVLLLIQKGSKQ